jgi:hypothetical protein
MSRAGSLALSISLTLGRFRTLGRLATLVMLAVLAGTSAGCAGTVRSASRAAVPVIVDESLGAFEDAHNRERLEQILGTPEMQGAIRETARGLVQGALGPGADARAQRYTAELTDTVAEVLAHDLRDRIIPATVKGMRDSLRASLTADDRRAMLDLVHGAIAQATVTAIRSASAEFPQSMAPAMREAIVESLNSPELHAALGGMAADATRSALVSSRDVLVELHDRYEGTGPVVQLVDRIQRMLERTIVATFAVGTLLGAFFIFAMRYFRGDPPGPRRVWRGPGGGVRGPGGGASPGSGGSADESPAERAGVRLDPSPTRAS